MSFTHGRAKTGGRKRGSRNKKTVAPKTYPDALDHLAAVIASKDAAITPDLKVRAAIGLAQYQHPKPTPLRPAPDKPIDLPPPKTAQEARDAIARITSMIARAEIDSDHGARIIAGLEAFLNARAAELELEVEKYRAEESAAP